MTDTGFQWVLGQMSGTSFDGIDLCAVRTDGVEIDEIGTGTCESYDESLCERLRKAAAQARGMATANLRQRQAWPDSLRTLEAAITDANIAAIRNRLTGTDPRPGLIGFHGQTILHRPDEKLTIQLGDGERIARELGIPVVWDFRQADLDAGGQGAPLAPFYHHALARRLEFRESCAFLNLGGVGNITFVEPDRTAPEEEGALLAFDTGPGCGLVDEWMRRRAGVPMDRDGACAAKGAVCEDLLARLLANPYFRRPPPKSLDKGAFSLSGLDGLSTADGAATLAAFTADSAALALGHCRGCPPRSLLVTGGGRRNQAIRRRLVRAFYGCPVTAVEDHGLDGDMLEAQAFAFLALRHRKGLPGSGPATTGSRAPVIAGRLSLP